MRGTQSWERTGDFHLRPQEPFQAQAETVQAHVVGDVVPRTCGVVLPARLASPEGFFWTPLPFTALSEGLSTG